MLNIDHRAGNALHWVQAGARLTHADEVVGFRKVVAGRIEPLARAHELLAENRWDGLDLRSLIEQELRAFADDGGRLRIAGPALRLPPQLAQTIALALHELATNAAKYGALKGGDGSLEVNWRDDGNRLVLDWPETKRRAKIGRAHV